MTDSERKQDTWFVTAWHHNKQGLQTFGTRGIVDLPHPMTAFEAAGCALSLQVWDVVKAYVPDVSNSVHVAIWGRRRPGLDPERYRMCEAVAQYDGDQDAFMRLTPWIHDDAREPVGDAEGAVFHPLNWK